MSDMQYTPPPPPPPPPPVVPPPVPPSAPQFDFGKPFTFVFDDPRWLNKILVGGLFYLAGFLLVGWFFIFGYVARTVRNVINGFNEPLPEWEELGAFFSEGLRLFGVALVWVLPFVILAAAVLIPAGILSSVDNQGFQALGSVMSCGIPCLIVPLSFALIFFMPASLLFAAVEQRFGAAFEFSRIWPFIKNNIGNYLFAVVVYLIARFLGGVGVVLFCIGVVFTGFWSFLITAHAFAQVYRLAMPRRA